MSDGLFQSKMSVYQKEAWPLDFFLGIKIASASSQENGKAISWSSNCIF